ncbi:ArnT family glycosyltransferase [Aristophania vespae]|uniref:ArnT family glycosyltransferase n=1 Tax=Aristophania vespae TaxID=2697033 RepID=UPI0023511871|nr:glycosyltransferase family 39 protein [Aristophania vespae]UMM64092.1 Undecaprenyl phosphate-alpha-4-amino-4-deoxy-L-arabinose arabinosyl transferase [Aristophania vespae]
MTLTLRHYALLALLAFFLALPGRMTLPPLDRDEARYMEATEQMVLSNDFLDIHFQNQPRYLQPAGIYWLEALSAKNSAALFGPQVLRQTWPYRIPSLIAASLIVPLTAWIGFMLFGASTAILGALFLMVSTLFVAESRMATIDTVLLLDILCVEAILVRLYTNRNNRDPVSPFFACAYWAALGIGLMLKGPIILIPGLATPLSLCLIERNFSFWRSLRPAWGWIITLIIVAPWCIGIALKSHGAFFKNAVGHNLLGKITHGQESHGFPPGYYAVIFILAFWPGALFTLRALPSIWERRKNSSVLFLLCWIVPYWLFFELLATKLPHYVLPTFPAIALLTAASLTLWPAPRFLVWQKIIYIIYALLWSVVAIAFCFAGSALLITTSHLISIRALIALGGGLPLVILAIFSLTKNRVKHAAYNIIGAAILIHAGLFWAVIPNLNLIQLSPHIASSFYKARLCSESVLISASYYEPSLVFLAGPQTRLLDPEQAAKSLIEHSKCDLALIDEKDKAVFLAELEKAGIKPHLYDQISGFNYSKGKKLNLSLFGAQ